VPSTPVLLLLAVLAIAGAVTLFLTWQMTFYQDTWAFLMTRRNPSIEAVFAPHNEHIVVFPVLLEQLSLRLFGMTSARPEYLLAVLSLIGTGALLFVYLRRRVGGWLALFGVSLIVFLGSAWEVLLWPFEIGFIGSIFFGLAALLAIEREEARWDAVACVLLILSTGFSSLGLPILAASAVALALGPPGQRARRAYVVAIPALLFGAWYLEWGHKAESHVSFGNLVNSPKYVAEAFAANAGSLLGLNPDPTTGALGRGPKPEPGLNPIWDWALMGVIVGGVAVRQARGRHLSPYVWPAATLALANWFLTALNYYPGREPTDSRYQYAGAIFTVMLLAGLLDRFKPGRRTIALAAAAAVIATVAHFVVLQNGADFLDEQSTLTRADTGAIEIARKTVDPGFQLTAEVAGTPTLPNIYADQYLEAVEEYGSPAYSPAELEAAPERGRYQADVVLTHALPLSLVPAQGADMGRCTRLRFEDGEVTLRPGSRTWIDLAPGPDATFLLRRFASPDGEYPIRSEGQAGGSVSELTIPADEVQRPWHLKIESQQPVHVCSTR
jgi:hypothetical protein